MGSPATSSRKARKRPAPLLLHRTTLKQAPEKKSTGFSHLRSNKMLGYLSEKSRCSSTTVSTAQVPSPRPSVEPPSPSNLVNHATLLRLASSSNISSPRCPFQDPFCTSCRPSTTQRLSHVSTSFIRSNAPSPKSATFRAASQFEPSSGKREAPNAGAVTSPPASDVTSSAASPERSSGPGPNSDLRRPGWPYCPFCGLGHDPRDACFA